MTNVAFKTLKFHKVVYRHTLEVGGIFSENIIINVLLIQTVNKFENRAVFDEVKAYKKFASLLGHPVHKVFQNP